LIRVIALVLITHYAGEDAAQGFLHNTAGLLMFAAALLGIFALDALFTALGRKRDPS
jgi:exosortase/archaeosortase family protein